MSVIISPVSILDKLHNDYLNAIEIDGKSYPSVTHYIYYNMMPDIQNAGIVKIQKTGDEARKKATGIIFGAKKGDTRRLPAGMEVVILKALRKAYEVKFSNPKYRDKLLGVKEQIVYIPPQHTFLEGDITVLGINNAQNGQNQLGKILEDIKRTLLHSQNILMKKIPESDKLFNIKIRWEMVIQELSKGRFPIDYSFETLYRNSRNIGNGDINIFYKDEFKEDIIYTYYQLYSRGKSIKKILIEDDIYQEFTTGSTDWIQSRYTEALKKLAVFKAFLQFCNISYDNLILSLAKKKVIENYNLSCYKIGKGLISVEEFLKTSFSENNLDILKIIGKEAVMDAQTKIYRRYSRGDFISIPHFEDRINDIFSIEKGLIFLNISFKKYQPRFQNLEKNNFKDIKISQDEPSSPKETYDGTTLDKNYGDDYPNGPCSDDNEKCSIEPNGDGDDNGDYNEFENDEYNDENKDEYNENEYNDENDEYNDENNEYNENDDENSDDRYEDGVDEKDTFNEEDMITVINNTKNPVIKKEITNDNFKMPLKFVKVSSTTNYPYEWLSPDHIDMFQINGYFYPSVSHYVFAMMATPYQIRKQENIRSWIQNNREYKFTAFSLEYDKAIKSSDYRNVDELRNELPERHKRIYNHLFVRFANKSLNIKMRIYPFRNLLFNTLSKDIKYYDNNLKAVAGTEIVEILTRIREGINDIKAPEFLPSPIYDKNIPILYKFIKDRTYDLLRSSILFSRYRKGKRLNYILPIIPTLDFGDIKFVVNNIYTSCKDIDYNLMTGTPPENYVEDFNRMFKELNAIFFKNLKIYDIHSSVARETINAKLYPPENLIVEKNQTQILLKQQYNEIKRTLSVEKTQRDFKKQSPHSKILRRDVVDVGDMVDILEKIPNSIFIDYKPILETVWTHICYLVKNIKENVENVSDITISQKIKDLRRDLFVLPTGTYSETAINAVLNILRILHSYYPEEKKIYDYDVDFINDFIFPKVAFSSKEYMTKEYSNEIEYSESYNTYNYLDEIISIYNSPDQDIKVIKRLAYVIDKIILFSRDDLEEYNKLVIRLKFFSLSK